MSLDRIQDTSLWRRSLGAGAGNQNKREGLRQSLLSFRQNASHVVAQVSATLPELTQHDITHLDALWETASVICGDDYPLNPLEAFVFGGAVLLHDSALCFEAYVGGKGAIRQTLVWRDHYESLREGNDGEDFHGLECMADFLALRSLHAAQAEILCEQSWEDPDTTEPLYLIENVTLRKHLGPLIGRIAASHHWDLDEVAQKLPNQVNALASYPRDWRIDPIKIACMLRCADAAHIDSERAPDFLHALIKRRGISFSHWKAQNKLSGPDIDQSDVTQSSLLFTSTMKYRECDSDSWWLAYDAAQMIDREIRESNAMLEGRGDVSLPFKAKRVKGVESPELMCKYIQVEGWSPCVADVHVSNVEKLIGALGGEQLYGNGIDNLEVAIRELVQNSRDAIHARREYDPEFTGRVLVRLKKKDNDYWLSIEDDGIGMSKRVLTGPLLDFGLSFWTSSLVQKEFPGLRSSKFCSIGRFGIGFYSIFMCAEEVQVTTRPWKGGASDICQLHFKNGLSLRPILKNSAPESYSWKSSTQVLLRIKPGVVSGNNFSIKRTVQGLEDIDVFFGSYVAAICAGLDAPVYFGLENGSAVEIHPEKIDESNCLDWIKRISFSREQSGLDDYIAKNSLRMRPIMDHGKCFGYAALSLSVSGKQNFLSIRTVGGLSTTVHGRSEGDYVGFIDYAPKSAKRDGFQYSASPSAVRQWAEDQKKLVDINDLDPLERHAMACSLCGFGVDPIDIAVVFVIHNKKTMFFDFDGLADLALHSPVAFFKSNLIDHIECHHVVDYLDGYALVRPLSNGNFLSLKEEKHDFSEDYSMFGCLLRAILLKGYKADVKVTKNFERSAFGMMDLVAVKALKQK
jgi:hypothetical protein